jgi:hypothetical protein
MDLMVAENEKSMKKFLGLKVFKTPPCEVALGQFIFGQF